MGVLDTAKSVAKLASDVQNMDLYRRAVDLMAEVVELTQENTELKKQLAQLQERMDRKEKLVFHNNGYWYGTKTATQFSPTDGPFCSTCFDTTGTLVRLHKYVFSDMGGEYFDCPQCEKEKKRK